jgi:uncharacterized membrane protein YgcG
MNNLYEALEICLQAIEQGADVDTVLTHYPDLANELRPILEASKNASSLAVPVPSAEVVRRNRARVLQRAAQMRESKRSARRIWFASFRRVAVTLAVVAILFASGTGLVRAASNTLPGDHLYPVKRTWEDMLVLFTFNSQQRSALEVEQENERIYELKDLFAEKRSVEVEFSGQVTSQNADDWMVSGIPVIVSPRTTLDQGITVGSAVSVKGQTQSSGAVSAERIGLLPSGAQLPSIGDEQEFEDKNPGSPNPQIEDRSGEESEGESPKIEATATPGSESEQQNESSNDGSGKGSDSGSGDHNSGSSHDGGGDHSDGGHDGGGDSGEGGD